MKIGYLFIGILVACLVSGCSNKSESSNNLTPRNLNFGTVEFASGEVVKKDAGDGLTCEITTTVLEPNTLKVVVTIKKGDKEVSTTQAVPVMPDRPLHFDLAGLSIDFTPHMK